MRLSRWLLGSGCPRGVVLIRIAVGTVFVSEGIQKFLYPATLGVGRFATIGIPAPDLMGPFVGVIEIPVRRARPCGVADANCGAPSHR